MRLLHTSDWHLGRSFHREDLAQAQQVYLDFLVETVRSERVDVVLVSGDVYDRALPSVDAVDLCNDALRRLAALKVRTVLISGNHDSARRLGFGADLIDSAGIHLRTDPARCGEPVLVEDRNGTLAVYGVPYLEPDAVRDELGCAERGHGAVLGAAMDRIRADLSRRAAGTRSAVLAHAFVTGGQPSDSERDISVGGVSSVPTGVFDGVDYVALGHLHGAQSLRTGMRYSGSPLAYSFSEEHQTKAMWLVDLGGGMTVEQVRCPVPRRVARIRGTLDHLLTEPAWQRYEDCYLQVTLTDQARPREPMERLRTRFPHTLVLDFAPAGGQHDRSRSYGARLRGLADLEISSSFVEHVRSVPATPEELGLLCQALEAQRMDEDTADRPAEKIA
jgi:DNA repair protein SbcD/Mre11